MSAATSAATPRTGSAGFHHGYAIALLSGLAVFAGFGLGRFVYGLLLPPMKAAFSMNYAESAGLAFANLVVYMVAAPVAGSLASRYGPRKIIVGALIVLGVAFLGLAWAPTYWAAFVFFALVGVGSGMTIIPSLGILSAWFAPSRRGIGTGIALAGPPLCFVLTGIFVPQLLDQDPSGGWRTAWLIFAVITFVVAVIVGLALRNRPAEVGRDPIGGPIARPAGIGQGIRAVLNIRPLWTIGAVYTCFGVAYVIYMTFLPSYLQQELGLPASVTKLSWILIGVAAFFGPFFFGWLSDRIGRRYGLSLLLFLLAIALTSLIVLPVGLAPPVSAVAYGFVMVAIVGVASAACGDYAGPALAPAAIGFATAFLGVGQAIGPMAAGPIADATGSFVPSLLASAAVSLVGSVLALFLPRPGRRPDFAAAPAIPAAAPISPAHTVSFREASMSTRDPTTPPNGTLRPADPTPLDPQHEWIDWARRTIAHESAAATDLSEWATRTPDADLAETLEIAAARARDRAYRLRRSLPPEHSRNGSLPGPAALPWAAAHSDTERIDLFLTAPSPYSASLPLSPETPEAGLLGQLRRSEEETIHLLAEQRDRLRALADRSRIRYVESAPGEGIGTGEAYWKVLRPAGDDGLSLARVAQRPGTALRLPPGPADRLIIWQDGQGACRPIDDEGVQLTAGQVAEIAAGASVEIAVLGDWPATYFIVSSTPMELGEAVGSRQ